MSAPISNRGQLDWPNLDTRTWQVLVDEAMALIPKFAPQWTDYNPSDIGVTLIELFAFLVEGLLYQLNRVPEKNYVAFLKLLGVTRDPATPASTYLTFSTSQPLLVKAHSRVQTSGTPSEPPVPFETEEDRWVLPIDLAAAFWSQSENGDAGQELTSQLVAPPASGCIGEGRALVVAAKQTAYLYLGFARAKGAQTLPIEFLMRDPTGGAPQVWWSCSQKPAGSQLCAWSTEQLLGADGKLNDRCKVSLNVPADWATAKLFGRSTDYAWIRFKIVNRESATTAWNCNLERILFNSVLARNVLTVDSEDIGVGSGEPFQVFRLKNCPLFKAPSGSPYDHLTVNIDGATWMQTEEIPFGAGSNYRVNPVSGELLFGNFSSDPKSKGSPKGQGTMPAPRAKITASYRYVAGGEKGNVSAGALCIPVGTLPGLIAVANFASAQGGADEEPIEETKRRAPLLFRVRNRAVTVEDYEYLAKEASTQVAAARCLPPMPPGQSSPPGIDRGPGKVNLVITAKTPAVVDKPMPSRELIDEVTRCIDQRRTIDAQLTVRGPAYRPIAVNLTISFLAKTGSDTASQEAQKSALQAALKAAIEIFLHPQLGGPDGSGWKVGQSIHVADVYRELFRGDLLSPEVGYVSSLSFASGGPTFVKLEDHELVCKGVVAVTVTS